MVRGGPFGPATWCVTGSGTPAPFRSAQVLCALSRCMPPAAPQTCFWVQRLLRPHCSTQAAPHHQQHPCPTTQDAPGPISWFTPPAARWPQCRGCSRPYCMVQVLPPLPASPAAHHQQHPSPISRGTGPPDPFLRVQGPQPRCSVKRVPPRPHFLGRRGPSRFLSAQGPRRGSISPGTRSPAPFLGAQGAPTAPLPGAQDSLPPPQPRFPRCRDLRRLYRGTGSLRPRFPGRKAPPDPTARCTKPPRPRFPVRRVPPPQDPASPGARAPDGFPVPRATLDPVSPGTGTP